MAERTRQLHLLPRNAHEALPLDQDGVIMQSVPCLECGYVVRGMKASQFCPECGTPIARSLRGLLLRFADVAWLGMVRAGITFVAAFVLLNVLMPPDLISAWFDGDPVITPVLWVVMAFVTGLFLVGQWMLTTAEPTGILSRREDRWRLTIRALSVLAVLLLLLHDAVVTRIGPAIEAPVTAATAIVILGVVVFTGRYMRGIADRIPDEELRTATTMTAIGLGVSLGGYIVTVLWMAGHRMSIGELRPVNIATLIVTPGSHTVIVAIFWLIAILAVISTVGAVAVLIGFRAAIREMIDAESYE